MPVRLFVVLLALALALSVAATGCGDTVDDTASRGSSTEEVGVTADDGIEVPNVSGEDGATAQSDVEDAGLMASFTDANQDPSFDTTRDGSGCEVTGQDPGGRREGR